MSKVGKLVDRTNPLTRKQQNRSCESMSRREPRGLPAQKPGGFRRTEDEVLFELRPARDRPAAYTHTDPWRVLRIIGEFIEGFDELSDIEHAISIFGSARAKPGTKWYELAVETAKRFGKENVAVVTGGGPGIMEAGNKGAADAETLSVGLSIELPHEQGVNPFADRVINFRYFFVRKTMFVKYSSAFVVFPGGFGTLDELFEALTLIQTEKIRNFPVVLMGKSYWKPLLHWLSHTVLEEEHIGPEDLELLHVTDDPEDAVQYVIERLKTAFEWGDPTQTIGGG
jgi:uncharacterized protein (TIGR00730 family)